MANLRIPGPTPIPDNVREALSAQMINHRGPEYAALLGRVTEGLRPFFRTEHDILIYTCSGTGVMEAAIVNTLSPGDKVLAVSIGSFGDRFGDYRRGLRRRRDPPQRRMGHGGRARGSVGAALRAGPAYKAVLVTHNETSTGVENPIEAIARGRPRRERRAAHRRRRLEHGLRPRRDRRLGPRPRRHGLAEGLGGTAGAGHGRRRAARLGRLRDRRDAPLLPRPRQAPRLRRHRPAALDARRLHHVRPRRLPASA